MKTLNLNISGGLVKIELPNGQLSVDARETPNQSSDQMEWSKTLLDGERVTFEKAEKAVAKLGEGWRLPTRDELQSLVDTSRHEPAIDVDKFPDTKSTWYWTSTPCAWNSDARWVVGFYNGNVAYNLRFNGACVRAVRASQ